MSDAALLVDPLSTDEITLAIGRVLSSHNLRDELRAKGIERAAEYSWARTARETLAVYERVADDARRAAGAG